MFHSRRSENFSQQNTELCSNGIKVELLKSGVYKDGIPIDLTANEYKLLCLFMENPDIVLSPEQILIGKAIRTTEIRINAMILPNTIIKNCLIFLFTNICIVHGLNGKKQ